MELGSKDLHNKSNRQPIQAEIVEDGLYLELTAGQVHPKDISAVSTGAEFDAVNTYNNQIDQARKLWNSFLKTRDLHNRAEIRQKGLIDDNKLFLMNRCIYSDRITGMLYLQVTVETPETRKQSFIPQCGIILQDNTIVRIASPDHFPALYVESYVQTVEKKKENKPNPFASLFGVSPTAITTELRKSGNPDDFFYQFWAGESAVKKFLVPRKEYIYNDQDLKKINIRYHQRNQDKLRFVLKGPNVFNTRLLTFNVDRWYSQQVEKFGRGNPKVKIAAGKKRRYYYQLFKFIDNPIEQDKIMQELEVGDIVNKLDMLDF